LAIASLFSLAFFFAKGVRLPKSKSSLLLLFLYGFLAVPLALGILFIGLSSATVLDLTLISAIGPMVVTLGAGFLLHEHITKKERLGIVVVLIGVFLNIFYPLLANGQSHFTGNLFLLAFLFADSSSALLAKFAVRKKINSITLTNSAFLIGAVFLIPITSQKYGFANLVSTIINLPLRYHLGVWYMALISGSLAYYLYVKAQRSIEVSEAILFNYLQPVFSIPLALFWLGEKITPAFLLGALIIALGVIIAEYKKAYK